MPKKPFVPNVLAERYASYTMCSIWSPTAKIIMERELWVAVMEAQRDLGLNIPEEAIEAYKAVIDKVDLDAIERRERNLRHDVKARLEEFNGLAGYEHAHKGMTSRDLTENVEQMQIRQSLELVRDRIVTVLANLSELAVQFTALPMAGRSHNAPAQVTTLGKRFANAAEEQLRAYYRLNQLLENYPLRGIKGPMGTQQDMTDLFGGHHSNVNKLEKIVQKHLGFTARLDCVGQIYPRSLDADVLAMLVMTAASPANLATTIRLMAGNDLVTEGFKEGQVGSSAMPHKMNARSCERVCGFLEVLKGYQTMVNGLVGHQWNEGDVSCSVVRRVAITDGFLAIDGMLETYLTVLTEFGAFPAIIERELNRYLPFLATTKILMEAVRAGAEREKAHQIIKKHAVAFALEMRNNVHELSSRDLLERIVCDEARLPVQLEVLEQALANPLELTGNAQMQVGTIVGMISSITRRHPNAVCYKPEEIL